MTAHPPTPPPFPKDFGDPPAPPTPFEVELRALVNRHSRENRSGTPDYLLADYLVSALKAFEEIVVLRDLWWDHHPKIGGVVPAFDPPLPRVDQ